MADVGMLWPESYFWSSVVRIVLTAHPPFRNFNYYVYVYCILLYAVLVYNMKLSIFNK